MPALQSVLFSPTSVLGRYRTSGGTSVGSTRSMGTAVVEDGADNQSRRRGCGPNAAETEPTTVGASNVRPLASSVEGVVALGEAEAGGHRQLAEFVWRYGHGWIGRVGLRGLCQAAMAVLVTWFQVVNRSAISRRYSSASSRWRPGRKCGDIPLKADKNRWACPGEVNRFMARSLWRVG